MAMTMNGQYELPVPPQTVWEKLNDPATLKACIPGCEQLDKTSDTEFAAIAPRSAERLQDFWPRRRRGRRLRQGRRHCAPHAEERWHVVVLQRRRPDRRQARPTRPAARQWRRKKSGQRFLCEFRQGGESTFLSSHSGPGSIARLPLSDAATRLTGGRVAVQSNWRSRR